MRRRAQRRSVTAGTTPRQSSSRADDDFRRLAAAFAGEAQGRGVVDEAIGGATAVASDGPPSIVERGADDFARLAAALAGEEVVHLVVCEERWEEIDAEGDEQEAGPPALSLRPREPLELDRNARAWASRNGRAR